MFQKFTLAEAVFDWRWRGRGWARSEVTIDRRAIYLGEGLGHCFVSLEDDSTVSYLVTDTYNASREHGINPLDSDVGLVFPEEAGELLLSPRDVDAPSLAEAAASGLLPVYSDVSAWYASLNKAGV